jgi:hypothetical protein
MAGCATALLARETSCVVQRDPILRLTVPRSTAHWGEVLTRTVLFLLTTWEKHKIPQPGKRDGGNRGKTRNEIGDSNRASTASFRTSRMLLTRCCANTRRRASRHLAKPADFASTGGVRSNTITVRSRNDHLRKAESAAQIATKITSIFHALRGSGVEAQPAISEFQPTLPFRHSRARRARVVPRGGSILE